MRSKQKADFEGLVGRIQAASDALQQDALVAINRSVTTRACRAAGLCKQRAVCPAVDDCALRRHDFPSRRS